MKKTKEPVYIIIPVHNRKAITLKCLETLKSNGDLDRYYVVVVDDGSTDGTSEAITEQYTDVIILKGDGNLWWTGAIELGMRYAYKQGADYFIWLNDDTLPSEEAISQLISLCAVSAKQIVAAQCYASKSSHQPTYGAFYRGWLNLKPISAFPGSLKNCDAINGNLACLPCSIIKDIGYPPADKVPHYHGDTTYSWQAKKQGYTLLLSGDAVGSCTKNLGDASWILSEESVFKLWEKLVNPKSPYYIRGFWHFCHKIWGIRRVLAFIQPYIRLSLISLLKWIFPIPMLQLLKVWK